MSDRSPSAPPAARSLSAGRSTPAGHAPAPTERAPTQRHVTSDRTWISSAPRGRTRRGTTNVLRVLRVASPGAGDSAAASTAVLAMTTLVATLPRSSN